MCIKVYKKYTHISIMLYIIRLLKLLRFRWVKQKVRTKMDKRKCRISRKRYIMRTLILLLVMTIGVIGAESVFANTHQTTLKPGDTYDCGKAKANTSVYINKPGKYTLKGSTRYVRIVICCGDVTCYLDGVNMNAGASTYVGKWASPLNVVDDGGTVTLISKKGTKNYYGWFKIIIFTKFSKNNFKRRLLRRK